MALEGEYRHADPPYAPAARQHPELLLAVNAVEAHIAVEPRLSFNLGLNKERWTSIWLL